MANFLTEVRYYFWTIIKIATIISEIQLHSLLYPNYILNISEVYVDSGKNTYSALDFNRMSILDLLPALFAPKGLQAGYKSWQLGLQGNMFGDGWQNGGCLVVEKGGGNEPLLYYIQEKRPIMFQTKKS